ncbi:MAG: hypothetical protein J6X24_07980, partial [Firmicutes bacterium]|nr:hypothetical protein [Bacillota bacterium]
ELAVPHMAALIDTLQLYTPQRLYRNLEAGFENYALTLQRLRDSAEHLIRSMIQEAYSRLELLKNDADLSNPMNVLDKGYAMARKDGSWKDRAAAFREGDRLDLRFRDGTLLCLVQEVTIHD